MPYLSLRDLATDQPLAFDTGEVRIGRNPDFELVVTGARSEVVSTGHARLFHRKGQWWLEDSGSRNGTFLGDEQLAPGTPVRVAAGGVIRLGARGPRYRVEAVDRDRPEETLAEGPLGAQPAAATEPLESLEDVVPPGPGTTPPGPPQELQLVLMEAKTGEQFKASGGRIRVGRGRECELRPVGSDDTSVSRVHAEILLKPDGRVVLRDAQSRNGTFFGNVRVQGDQELRTGDQFRLGPSGLELVVAKLLRPGQAPAEPAAPREAPPAQKPAAPAKPKKKHRRASLAQRVAAKVGSARRSFGGKGATVFFNEMFAESSRTSARRVRWIVWLFVVLVAGSVGAMYWYGEQRVRRATSEIQEQQRLALERLAARNDSIQADADAEYDRLRLEFADARAGSAPAAVVESLRVALVGAQEHTRSLEASLRRAEASLAEQLAAGDSANRAAQAELASLRSELNRASTAGTSSALLDSLRAAVRDAEERSTQIGSQMRAMRGSNLAAVAQANQSAIGLVTAYVGSEIYDGSGFAITPSGYFVTNRHVVLHQGRTPDSVYVTMADQKLMHRAEFVAVAQASGPDLAVLRVTDFTGPHVAQIDWTGENAKQGEPAALIGFPAGLGNALDATRTVRTSMSAGIFSKVTADVVNFDGFTVGGSSGSPIFNAGGEVVAVHRAGLREAVGMGFAVPIAKLTPLLPPSAKAELGLQ
jgi:pSer/pThr/pTyr-binding forkhead associated (FHA) protein/S1-C subfamily serine protease